MRLLGVFQQAGYASRYEYSFYDPTVAVTRHACGAADSF